MTPSYVLDSYALLAFFRNEQGAEVVKELLIKASAGACELWLTVINAGEVYYMTRRKHGLKQAGQVRDAMQQLPMHWVTVDAALALEAAKIKAGNRLSYADAIAAALSKQHNAFLVTGDAEYKALERTEDLKVVYL